ncbi:type 1 fimbrial protein [Pseudomonas yamanorum]|uniref:Type 1 fimbrial protein n=1 Tax=Pseudomonas yamanorum TaxID=515393 RepID=A0A7Y8K3X5_9PSED|nr:fimbrial protein [Pseudomonas yamanorum]NVZ86166.1 type 1 fimbrial protein [Pseudomonas yamanorum]NWE16898.1 type 1 fimbrial protein [Pseudomonas yamanorum]NWE43869.1 type 1 fimbrial protein [Pseudomonas yamanorum]NWE74649.1 type 1 fimbrial protein [Pseudomonas yamanorum]
MKTFHRALLALSIFVAAGNVMAAPTLAGGGTLNFTGSINVDACTASAGGANKNISVDMGNVAVKEMGTATAPKSNGTVTSQNFDMKINCNAGAKVAMIFDPTKGAGTGIVAGTKVLKLIDGVGTAKNVGIALLDSNGALIDLSSPTTALIESPLQGGNASLRFSAVYVTTATDVSTVVAGRGDATLPFTLQYE